jgi:hypothetical protein
MLDAGFISRHHYQEKGDVGKGGCGRDGEHTKIDVNPTLEESSQNLDNLRPRHTQLSRQREPFGHMLCIKHSLAHPFLEKAQLRALRNGMTDGQFHHVIALWQESNHIVEHPRPLQIGAVFEMELLRLEIGLVQRARNQRGPSLVLGKGEIG